MLFKTHNKITSCGDISNNNKADLIISESWDDFKTPQLLAKSQTSKFGLNKLKIDFDKTSYNIESKQTMYETMKRQSSIEKLNNLLKQEEKSMKKINSTVKIRNNISTGFNWRIGPKRCKTPKSFFNSKRNKSYSKLSKAKGYQHEDSDTKYDLTSQVTTSNQTLCDKAFFTNTINRNYNDRDLRVSENHLLRKSSSRLLCNIADSENSNSNLDFDEHVFFNDDEQSIKDKIFWLKQNLEESRKSKQSVEQELLDKKTLLLNFESAIELKIAVLNEKLNMINQGPLTSRLGNIPQARNGGRNKTSKLEPKFVKDTFADKTENAVESMNEIYTKSAKGLTDHDAHIRK